MTLKGNYSGETSYSVGDVVAFEDVIYIMHKPCAAGVPPTVTLYWERLRQDLADSVKLSMDAAGLAEAKIPMNINDEAITLKGSEDAEYLITVDDSGDTPELDVTLIEPEEDET